MDKYGILAVIFSPTVIALVTIFLVLRGHGSASDWVVSLSCVVIIPILPVIMLAAAKKTDLGVSDQAQRTPLLILAVLSYLAGFLFFQLRGFWEMKFVTLSYATVTVGVTVINALYTKSSIHMAGITGPSTILVLLGFKEGILLFLLSPIVAWVRLKVRAHDKLQIALGGGIAVILTVLSYLLCS